MKAQAAAVDVRTDAREIRSRHCPTCFLCGAEGEPLYEGLTDCLFDAPGSWNLKRCPNQRCGLIWLDPMPLEEDIGLAYRTYFTHGAPGNGASPPPRGLSRAATACRSAYRAWRFNYGDRAGRPLQWLLALPILLTRIECDTLDIPLRYLAAPEKGRMLDVGCGDGSIVALAAETGWAAEGVDFDPAAVANARSRGLDVRHGTLEAQRYPEGSFDLVLMSHVIEHVHDPLGTMREIRRILRPGGLLVATAPNAASWGHRHFGRHWRGLEPPRHLHVFNGRNFLELADRAGFARKAVSSTLRITSYCFVQSRLVRRTGRGETGQVPLREVVLGRGAALAEMLMRLWDPLAADELLLEARK